MKLQLKNASPASDIQLSDAAFGRAYNEALVHQVVTAYQAAGRAGTKAQKSRAEVRGGGKKPWSQKGTGQARVGSIRSPIWVGGGRAFAARPRDYSQKVNRKMYRAAMQSMLSQLVREDRLIAVASLELDAPKTKLLISKLAEFGVTRALIGNYVRHDQPSVELGFAAPWYSLDQQFVIEPGEARRPLAPIRSKAGAA